MALSYTAGVISVFIWALFPVILKSSLERLPVSYFLVLRFSFATLLMAIIMGQHLRSVHKIKWSQHLQFALILGANYGLQSLAIKDLPVSWYIVIFALNPLLALLLLRILLTKHLVASLLLGLSGVLLFVLWDENGLSSLTLRTFFYLFGGMLSWVLYTFKAKAAQKKLSDSFLAYYTQLISLIAVSIIWIFDGTPTIPFTEINPQCWTALFWSGMGLPAAYYLYLFSLRHTPVFSQLSQYLELIFGLIFSWALYGDAITQAKLIGSGLILCSLFFSSKIKTPNQVSEAI